LPINKKETPNQKSLPAFSSTENSNKRYNNPVGSVLGRGGITSNAIKYNTVLEAITRKKDSISHYSANALAPPASSAIGVKKAITSAVVFLSSLLASTSASAKVKEIVSLNPSIKDPNLVYPYNSYKHAEYFVKKTVKPIIHHPGGNPLNVPAQPAAKAAHTANAAAGHISHTSQAGIFHTTLNWISAHPYETAVMAFAALRQLMLSIGFTKLTKQNWPE